MAKGAGPILLLGAGALLIAGSKKKKKPVLEEPIEPEVDPVVPPPPPTPAPKPPDVPAGDPPDPSGDPAGYDTSYWNATEGGVGREGIRAGFKLLGYPVEVNDYPMNILGPKGSGNLIPNFDGSAGRLGGNDDKASAVVKQFQKEYNSVSKLGVMGEKLPNQVPIPKDMGSLAVDGKVGAKTVNGLRYGTQLIPFWKEAVSMAKNKGL